MNNNYLIILGQTTYHLKNMYEKVKVFPFEEFAFELCAFVQAARNVTFAMQKEHSGNKKFDRWYEEKQKEMLGDELLRFFVEKRNTIVKKGDSGTSAFTFYLEGHLSLPAGEELGITLTEGIFTPNKEIKAKTKDGKEVSMEMKLIRTPVFPELKNRHVIDACQEYYNKLNELVKELQALYL